ncbi:MAG: PaaI family thioesterase [Planctomycetes bacterium]|nr:PaaI family thioesterase [Planctomycetota bacterium]
MPDLAPDDPRRALFGQLGFDRSLAGMTLEAVEPGRAVVALPVTDAVVNMVGTLHGGAIATLVDDAGTIAIMSADQDGRPGVTTDLNVSYFAAAPQGETVKAEARCLKAGRTLAFVEVDIKSAEGKLLAQGRMTKFMGR